LAAAGYWTVGVDVKPESGAAEHLAIDMESTSCGEAIAVALGERSVGVLINNAAVAADASLLDVTLDAWETTIGVNLRAPWLVAKALHRHLEDGAGGSIVNVSSVHALASSPGAGVYATSKAGLVALTRAMALEWGPLVRANCVLPGAVDTPMLHAGLDRSGQSHAQIGDRLALRRVASPSEIARVIRFVASEAGYMTGSTIVVDGGALARLSSE
jgi:NAD(P)-dependent dehydrogenase (short-subunit alcohol dehydrogenase family)